MAVRLSAAFEVSTWDEASLDDQDDLPRLTRATLEVVRGANLGDLASASGGGEFLADPSGSVALALQSTERSGPPAPIVPVGPDR
ncbi:MAG: hypothetical protein ABSC90_06405 [Acidimicrobiales bacterium]|jgi:hypothetical protein